MNEEKDVSRECIFNIYAAEAQGFYKLVITIASSFLGGSLIFVEKIIT